MNSRKLPSVLQADNGNSISMERALKQIRALLEQFTYETDETNIDKFNASLDDIDTMLAAIDRGE